MDSIKSLLNHTQKLLIIAMILSFVSMGVIQVFYYSTVLNGKFDTGFVYTIAVMIAFIFQLSRIGFGLAAANESFNGRYLNVFFGLLFSLGITILETYEVVEIAAFWGNKLHSNSLVIMLFGLLWIGFCLEVRLIVNLSGLNKQKSTNTQQVNVVTTLPHTNPIQKKSQTI